MSVDDTDAFKPMSKIYTEQTYRVKERIDDVLREPTEDNIMKMIKTIQRGPHLKEDHVHEVSEACYETYWEEGNDR